MTHTIIHKYESIDSTNDEARRLVTKWNKSKRIPNSIYFETPKYKIKPKIDSSDLIKLSPRETNFPDTIILAETQTKGKGRLGRHWYSPPGNLYVTLIKSVPVHISKLPQLSLVVGLSVYHVLKSYIPDTNHIALKWPNDILIDGKKIGGILIETDFDDTKSSTICYIGIGINRLSAPDTIAYPTCCLLDFSTTPPSIDDLVSQIDIKLNELLNEWVQHGLQNLRDEWLWAAYGLGKPVSARVENGFMLYGRFVTLNQDGAFVIEDNEQIQHIVMSGEVKYLV